VFIVSQLLSKSHCHIMQFLHQMFNSPALLLKMCCYRFLFSIVAFKTLTFHKVM